MEWFRQWRERRRLFREFLHAELIYTHQYDDPSNKIYAGGDTPIAIGPGRVEILFFPASGKADK